MNPSPSPTTGASSVSRSKIEQTPPISSWLPELINGSTEFAGDAETVEEQSGSRLLSSRSALTGKQSRR